jgi:hypothetical protein
MVREALREKLDDPAQRPPIGGGRAGRGASVPRFFIPSKAGPQRYYRSDDGRHCEIEGATAFGLTTGTVI